MTSPKRFRALRTSERKETTTKTKTTSPKTRGKKDPTQLAAAAQAAADQIAAMEKSLPLDNDLVVSARKGASVLQYVPTEALTAAVTILGKHGDLFPSIDAAELSSTAQYEASMNQVATNARALAANIATSVLKRRSASVNQVLFMYKTLQARAKTDGTVLDAIKTLEPLVNTRKHPHKKPSKAGKQAQGTTAQTVGQTATPPGAAATSNAAPTSVVAAMPVSGASAPPVMPHS